MVSHYLGPRIDIRHPSTFCVKVFCHALQRMIFFWCFRKKEKRRKSSRNGGNTNYQRLSTIEEEGEASTAHVKETNPFLMTSSSSSSPSGSEAGKQSAPIRTDEHMIAPWLSNFLFLSNIMSFLSILVILSQKYNQHYFRKWNNTIPNISYTQVKPV